MCLRMVKQIYRSMLPGSYCTWYPDRNGFFYWQHKLTLTYTIAIIILLNVLLLFSKSHNSISKGLHLIFWKSHLKVLSTLHVPTQILFLKEEEARLTHCLWAQYCPRSVYILQQKSYDIVSTIVFKHNRRTTLAKTITWLMIISALSNTPQWWPYHELYTHKIKEKHSINTNPYVGLFQLYLLFPAYKNRYRFIIAWQK